MQLVSYLKYLRILAVFSVVSINTFGIQVNPAYRQQKVHNIHQTQHHIRDIVEAVDVRRAQQTAGDNVMGQHLVVVLPSLLNIDNQNLLHPKRQLHEQIPFQSPRHTPCGPFPPDCGIIEPVVRVRPDILFPSVPATPIDQHLHRSLTIPKVQKNP